MHVLNSEYVTQTRVNTEPTALSFRFADMIIPMAVKALYEKDQVVNKCAFRQLIKTQDEYGNDKTETMFTFNFTRDLYAKINWSKFSFGNFRKIAPQYKISQAIQITIAKELESGSDD